MLILPQDFSDYEWEIESKGWFSAAKIQIDGVFYRLNFYDPVRLAQEVESSLQNGVAFFEPNLVVVPSLTKANMEQAVQRLAQTQQLEFLVAVTDHDV
jgi:hypothetical protein